MSVEDDEDRSALVADFGEAVFLTSPDGRVSVVTAIFEQEHAGLEIGGYGQDGLPDQAIDTASPAIVAPVNALPSGFGKNWRVARSGEARSMRFGPISQTEPA